MCVDIFVIFIVHYILDYCNEFKIKPLLLSTRIKVTKYFPGMHLVVKFLRTSAIENFCLLCTIVFTFLQNRPYYFPAE